MGSLNTLCLKYGDCGPTQCSGVMSVSISPLNALCIEYETRGPMHFSNVKI